MAGDLGTDGTSVHDAARAVIDFWFSLPLGRHFARDDALDARIARRFGDLRDAVFASRAAAWRETPDALLAAIVLLDQFSRNIHRDSPRAYEADDLAVELTLLAIDRGWEAYFTVAQRAFLYMPLMHAEDLALQRLCVDRFSAMRSDQLRYAEGHRDVIARFGRFPTRNAVLGRETTAEEHAYLVAPDDGRGPPKA